ncbi:sensor histidine kinase [Arcobacter sp. F155]|uniref:sensor histidine kinase n=1 Tax=Arcobacter sp. F155 TaxID=2044512 RepID=UPI002159E588|nr:histidine kinase dimerization/phosphoacceptor domain -containing protein [Arcobacter sp. F155]
MARIFKLKNYSFTTKVIFSFFLMLIFIYGIRTALTIPKIHSENEKDVIEHITRTLMIIKNQFMIIGKSIGMQANLERELTQNKIANEFLQNEKLLNSFSKEELLSYLSKNEYIKGCSFQIENFDESKTYKEWTVRVKNNPSKAYRKQKTYHYNFPLDNKNNIVLACSHSSLNPGHSPFEKELKKHFHEKLVFGTSLSEAKTALFWLNTEFKEYDTPLYSNDINIRKSRYTLSNLSNVKNLPIGDLSLKELLEADEKKPISHKIDGKEVLTWVINLSPNAKNNRYFILIHSINKEEIINKNSEDIIVLLNETLLTIAISFLLILFLFRRILKNIDKITRAAIEVNQGKKNIRSRVNGDDDIGILGHAFDSMLELFENNIKTLDKKVEEKTKEITRSLEEKELLLKEIHHRVKNNLALTIGLIELQEEDVQDEKTRKVLKDIQERIFTMELLHRKLYESENINDIPFKTYVKDLVSTIAHSYDMNNKVAVSIKMEEIKLNIEKAMPCGLILNELITNSFKYAFCKNEEAKLDIEITKDKETLIMSVKDNGKGLEGEFDELHTKTLGLKLINTIVRFQLFGFIDYIYDEGAKFIIKAKVEDI